MEFDTQTTAKTTTETSPNKTTDTAEQQSSEVPKNKVKGLWFTRFIAILALFLTVSGIAVGYKTWNDVNHKANEIRNNLNVAQAALSNVPNKDDFAHLKQNAAESLSSAQQQSEATLAEIQHLAKATQHYAESVDTQIASITHLQAQVQQNAAQQSPVMATWLLSETEYLIRLANHHLQLTGEHQRALKALQAADDNLLRLAMPHYLPVRQQLAQDIAALEIVNAPDIIGLYLHIAGIIKKLEPLPSPIVSTQEKVQAQDNTESDQSDSEIEHTANAANANNELETETENNTLLQDEAWQGVLNELQSSLSKAVSIRKNGEPLKYLLDSESRYTLYELLRIRLETLRLLVLEKNNHAYHQHIQGIKSLVDEYYPADSAQAQTLHQQLAALDKTNLEPPLPDISGSLKAFTSAQYTQPPSAAEKAMQKQPETDNTDPSSSTQNGAGETP